SGCFPCAKASPYRCQSRASPHPDRRPRWPLQRPDGRPANCRKDPCPCPAPARPGRGKMQNRIPCFVPPKITVKPRKRLTFSCPFIIIVKDYFVNQTVVAFPRFWESDLNFWGAWKQSTVN